MSTYYEGCLITNGKWIANKLDMNIVKNFVFDDLDETYSETLIEDAVAFSAVTTNEFIGQVLKEKVADFSKLNAWKRNKIIHAESEETILLSADFDKEEIEQIFSLLDKKLDYKEYMSFSEDERKNYNQARYNVYVKIPYRFRNGKLISAESVKRVQEDYIKDLEKAKAKKVKWEDMQISLDYLKLSAEEKENIRESFNYLGEDIEYFEYAINSLNQILYTLDFFNSAYYDETAYLYVYNTDYGRAEYPDWFENLKNKNI